MLAEKVQQLKATNRAAEAVTLFWENQIAVHGEPAAEAFYTSLGLNHLHTKAGVEWDGLMLSREPNDIEKLCVKGISMAQDAGKAQVREVLMKARAELIAQALKGIKKLAPADYHTLIVNVPDKLTVELRDQLGKIFLKGKRLVAAELAAQAKKSESKAVDDPTDAEDAVLDETADLTNAQIANGVQSRAAETAARLKLLQLRDEEMMAALESELLDGSVAWLERAATGAANFTINQGRSSEAQDEKDQWEAIEYSAIMDGANTCDACASEDGQQSSNEDDLEPVPNISCDGGANCRCFWVYIAPGG